MANTPFLLQSKLDFNPLVQQTFHLPRLASFHSIRLSSGVNNAFKSNNSSYKGSRKLGIKCFFMSHKLKGEKSISGNDLKTVTVGSGIDEVFWRSIKNVLKALIKPVITAVLLGWLLLYDHHHGCVALAASGGRLSPQVDMLLEESHAKPSKSVSTETTEGGGPTMTESIRQEDLPAVGCGCECGSHVYPFMMGFGITACMCGLILGFEFFSKYYKTEKTSVVKLQVGLLGTGRSLQKELNRIFKATNTSSRERLKYILQGTTLALLRHPEDCISGYSCVDVDRSVAQSQIRFNQLSVEERVKFHEEIPVNVSNIRKLRASTQRSNNGLPKEYIVITIIVKADGVLKLPPINSSARLKEALQKLASIPSKRIEAAEVLLTPQNENNTLTEQELLVDYSLLRPL